jgi:pyridoxal phosphate enzyme (YggS family)
MSAGSGKSTLAERLEAVQQEISHCAKRVGRQVQDITLVAVSKTHTLEEVKAVAELGQRCFGENTIQDAMTKVPFMGADIDWHFIGHLQSKKAGKLAGHFQWIHSVDSLKLARKLSNAMLNHSSDSILNCLVQVNVSGEESKSGLMPEEVEPFLKQVLALDLPCLRWRGLMTIGVRGDEQQTRAAFRQLRDLLLSCQSAFDLQAFDQLSMGMSNDYCMAIEEGATMVRVGTSIFGARNYPAKK